MKSIKPGRGPSAMGLMGSIFGIVFAIFWTIMAVSMGAPWFFCMFGVMFVIMAIATAIYNYKNVTGKNRYSEFDIGDEHEESDPFNDRFGFGHEDRYADEPGRYDMSDRFGRADSAGESNFCPYCGAPAGPEFEFCNKCGKKLP